jgi:purine-nucleoside phosphorylase
MSLGYKEIKDCADFLAKQGFDKPEIGVVLGTGLGAFVNELIIEKSLEYSDIPNFPVATVEFHSGKLHFGTVKGKRVVVMQGRFHYYEGYSMDQIVFPIRVMKLLGIQQLLVSNAAGAINPGYKKGELMLLDDHINLQPENPLRGVNIDELGSRFPDMSAPYSSEMNASFKDAAKQLGIRLQEGVYASVTGPNLETRAEYRYLRTIGADAVGMSTVPEIIAAVHMGLPTAAISVLTDECDPDNLQAVDISEIIAIAGKSEKVLIQLVLKAIF